MQCQFSNVTMKYLEEFNRILEKMICNMKNAKLTNSISNNFIVQMIPHHRAAIEMSCNILQYTTDLTLQEIASNIVAEQTKSIENMLAIQHKCCTAVNSRQQLCWYQNQIDRIMQTMFSNMKNASATNCINCNFLWEMIPHHMGAVEMAQTTLRCGICPELRPILQAIKQSQKSGIEQMEKLLSCLNC